ncbi:MAG: hypothetical protein A2X79_00670 [Desulfuromonadaceae bacterium GWB2_53_15]|nr:MAG: hypothetical protein A2X79_00670 [Desulfuromonadaceae bacterium GWB2_53_15]
MTGDTAAVRLGDTGVTTGRMLLFTPDVAGVARGTTTEATMAASGWRSGAGTGLATKGASGVTVASCTAVTHGVEVTGCASTSFAEDIDKSLVVVFC